MKNPHSTKTTLTYIFGIEAMLCGPVSDLTANDSERPANESSQTFSVTAVSSARAQEGTVTLSGGALTYAPAANFNGMAMLIGTPASSSAACQTGALQFDSNYLYACIAPNTWKRSAWSSF